MGNIAEKLRPLHEETTTQFIIERRGWDPVPRSAETCASRTLSAARQAGERFTDVVECVVRKYQNVATERRFEMVFRIGINVNSESPEIVVASCRTVESEACEVACVATSEIVRKRRQPD